MTLQPSGLRGQTIVYGAGCVWWDSIDKAGTKPPGLPCCPHCGSVLFETSEVDWVRGYLKQDAEQPGYLDLLIWSRGRCFKTWNEAKAAYAAENSQPDASGSVDQSVTPVGPVTSGIVPGIQGSTGGGVEVEDPEVDRV